MDYPFPQASSSRGSERPSASRAGSGNMPFTGPNPRRSSKRSFDEYGHLESQSTPGPSGSSSMMTTPTSSVVGAAAMLGLGNTSSIANHFGNPLNNAQNTRNKRRRGSLSPPQAEGSLHIPSMPVGTSISTSSSVQRALGHSASNSAESLMSWMDTPPQVDLQQSMSQMTTQVTEMPSMLNGGQSQSSRNLDSGDSFYEPRQDESRDNRMSWMPDTSQATDTVTTNTEPGWNFGPRDHSRGGPTMEFPMPHAQTADSLNQSPLNFLERNSFESNDENNGPQMLAPPFYPDTRPATSDFDNHTSPNLIPPRSPSSIYMESWYRSHDSRRNGPSHSIVPPSPIESPPSPPAWRDSPPQPQPQPAHHSPATSSSWWPLRWGFDGAISPPPPQVPRGSAQEARPSATSSRQSATHPASIFLADNPPDHRGGGPAQLLRPAFSRPWEPYRVETPPSWPPYHIPGSSEATSSRIMFPEPQSQGARRNNGYTSQPRDEHSMHRAGSRTFDDSPPAVGPSSSPFSTFGTPSGIAGPRPHDFHALPMPSVASPSRHSASSYLSGGDRGMRLHEESTHSRISGRIPSPPPARRLDILDRYTRNRNSGVEFENWRSHHGRSNSDSSTVDPYHQHQPLDLSQRRGERLEHWGDETHFMPGDLRGEPFQRAFDRSSQDRSSGPSTVRPRSSRPEPRNRPDSSTYDGPLLRDLVSSHSSHQQERDRMELHSSLARTQLPPPVTRRSLSGAFDYVRGGNAGSSASAHPIGRGVPPPSPTRAPPRSNSPVSSRPFPPLPPSRRPPSPASRPSPFRLDPFSHSPPNEPSERPSESRSTRTRQSRRRERDSRLGRLFGVEQLALLGSDDDFPYYDPFNVTLDDPEVGAGIAAAERIRTLHRFRAGRRPIGGLSIGRMRAMGDYVLDDDFDPSYETLMTLGQIVGPVKRGCSEGTLDELPHGTYAEFLAGGSDDNKVLGDNGNCAICLEDYVPTDVCTKLPRCLHFYHKDCVKEWLKTAKTCPVCRENVEGPQRVKGSSRSSRVRFLPISEAQRENQDPALQYLRDTNGAGPATIPAPRPPRRRSTNEGRSIPPPPSMFQDVERGTSRNSDIERTRRLRMPPRAASSILGEFDDPWPAYSPPSPPIHPFGLHRLTPSPPFMDVPAASSRFTHRALARALEGNMDDYN